MADRTDELRVRFPPSPTGYLHIGSARTALYNWLLARKHGGRLVLRIEDTDAARSTEASTRAILEGLRWMGITWDEGPYNQTDHAEEHRAVARALEEAGHAYRCYCTPDELAARREKARAEKGQYGYDGTCRDLTPEQRAAREAEGRSHVVRFRVPRDRASFRYEDRVYGVMEVPADTIEDFVIVRSNGEPLYVLSNVVDDHRDRVNLVVRGADHRFNTIKQILIYEAMGWPVPDFGHIPLTLDPKRAKISKRRHGEVVTVEFYRDRGFLPWAFCNFVALQGWNAGDDREVYLTPEELVEAFDLSRVSRTNSVFNYDPGNKKFFTDPKAIHINAAHIRGIPLDELAAHLRPWFEREGLWDPAWDAPGEARERFLATLDLIRQRYHLLGDFVTLGRAWFADDFDFDPKAVKKRLSRPELAELLPALAERLAAVEPWDAEHTETTLRAFCEERGVKPGLVINAARVATTGQAVGPGIFDVFASLGRERTTRRIAAAAERFFGS